MTATTRAVLVQPPLAGLPWDEKRGSAAMLLFILTEAMLFVALFFGYFYLGAQNADWPMDEPPKLKLATAMLVVLLASSVVLRFGERASRQGRTGAARLWLAGTIALGAAFVVLQVFEYRDHLQHLTPMTDAYGSIFYAITTLHALHLLLGLSMLCYVLVLPDLEGRVRPPHRPLHNAGLYWHFVDLVWVFIVSLLYYLPHLTRS